MTLFRFAAIAGILFAATAHTLAADDTPVVVLPGGEGIGKGKHIVLLSGDQEYRSEETIPQLAKILSKHHGFKCTVLFTLGKDGTIDPAETNPIPGLEALKTADLFVIFTRFLNPPDEQMAHIDEYIKAASLWSASGPRPTPSTSLGTGNSPSTETGAGSKAGRVALAGSCLGKNG